MKTKLIIPFLVVFASNAFADMQRLRCPQASEVITPTGKTVEDYADYLKANNMTAKTELSVDFLEEFIFEYEKFPLPLREELVSNRTKINLMEGDGVTVDPTWSGGTRTFDGREWKYVPGAGGRPGGSPTRVVINHLYENHGSVNLVLHEHGHTLDDLYKSNVVSKSKTWKGMLEANPQAKEFLGVICGAYCQDNLNEGFAELFAYYHACPETREQVEAELPEFATFLAELNSIKEFKKADKNYGKSVEQSHESTIERAKNKVREIFGKWK